MAYLEHLSRISTQFHRIPWPRHYKRSKHRNQTLLKKSITHSIPFHESSCKLGPAALSTGEFATLELSTLSISLLRTGLLLAVELLGVLSDQIMQYVVIYSNITS